MNTEQIKAINQLANAIEALCYYVPSAEDKEGVKAHLENYRRLMTESVKLNRDQLISVIDNAVDEHQTLDAAMIADAILSK